MTKGREEVKVGTLLLGNECYCQLFNELLFVFQLLRLNVYLKGYLKSRKNKQPEIINNY